MRSHWIQLSIDAIAVAVDLENEVWEQIDLMLLDWKVIKWEDIRRKVKEKWFMLYTRIICPIFHNIKQKLKDFLIPNSMSRLLSFT